MFRDKPHRLRGFDYLGLHRYFLTFCTSNRRAHFVDKASVDLVLTEILRAAEREQFAVVAYCFMPDHLHLLVEGVSEQSDGRRFVRMMKQLSGYHWQRSRGRPLWQAYGYERVLRSEDDTRGVVRYIIENPVRAGLVQQPTAYPFSGSSVYSMDMLLDAVAWKPRGSG